jgi:hypothetical protein
MTIAELREEIGFTAGIPDIDALGGWFDYELRSIVDEYTAITKYDDLYVNDVPLSITSTASLPMDLQHLDEANVRFMKGDMDHVSYLTKGDFVGPNVGPPEFFQRTFNQSQLTLNFYPYDEISLSDRVIINYWRTFYVDPDDTIVLPSVLGPILRSELIARANAYLGDGKKYQTASGQANKAFIRGMGTVPLQSQNR